MSKIKWPITGRIPYLDGLRAFSIALVVIGHSKPYIPFFKTRFAPLADSVLDGHFGVRVFFVLSGFLITTLLFGEEDKTGRISITGFYERRIARIFPAFYLYILTLVVLTLLHSVDLHWPDFVTASTFLWNYQSLWTSPSAAASEILGHLWTLSLEEQFYLVWPATLILLGRKRGGQIAVGSILVFPVLRVASYFLIPATRGQLMMMFHTGADMIMWGAMAAYLCKDGILDRFKTLKFRGAIPWLCGFGVFVLRPVLEAKIRGAEVVITPTLECVCIVAFIFWLLSGEMGIVRRVLESWPMVQLGLLSYSLYLWQQLFILSEATQRFSIYLRILGALVAAVVSYRLVEIPSRAKIRGWFAQSKPAH